MLWKLPNQRTIVAADCWPGHIDFLSGIFERIRKKHPYLTSRVRYRLAVPSDLVAQTEARLPSKSSTRYFHGSWWQNHLVLPPKQPPGEPLSSILLVSNCSTARGEQTRERDFDTRDRATSHREFRNRQPAHAAAFDRTTSRPLSECYKASTCTVLRLSDWPAINWRTFAFRAREIVY